MKDELYFDAFVDAYLTLFLLRRRDNHKGLILPHTACRNRDVAASGND
jgi:hypothetical protein